MIFLVSFIQNNIPQLSPSSLGELLDACLAAAVNPTSLPTLFLESSLSISHGGSLSLSLPLSPSPLSLAARVGELIQDQQLGRKKKRKKERREKRRNTLSRRLANKEEGAWISPRFCHRGCYLQSRRLLYQDSTSELGKCISYSF